MNRKRKEYRQRTICQNDRQDRSWRGNGILAWHPDRPARNSVDGEKLSILLILAKLSLCAFPQFWFEPTPQGKFMLQVAFGQSKYFSDNLVENVKRGIRQKLRRGEWPTKPLWIYK